MLGKEFRRLDTGHRQTLRLVGDVAGTCYRYAKSSVDKSIRWGEKLYELGECVHGFLAENQDDKQLTEQWICSGISGWVPDNTHLFIGNSLPIRMMEMFSHHPVASIFTNRGVSGIDGLMATAAGCSAALAEPVVLLIGDVSFLHDLNSLQLARQIKTPLVIILINNDGGNIFNMLPMGTAKDKLSEYFVTPHGLDALHGAAMFHIPYSAPTDTQQFQDCLHLAMEHQGCSIIEVKTMPGQAAESIRNAVSLIRENL